MNIQVKVIKGYSCPNKHLLIIDNEPVIFANSNKRISTLISYVEGYISEEAISDKSITRILDKWRKK